VVVDGAGAAGVACTDIMLAHGVGDVVVCNRRALYAGAEHLDAERRRSPSARTRAAYAARRTRG
jgi:malic enzyme